MKVKVLCVKDNFLTALTEDYFFALLKRLSVILEYTIKENNVTELYILMIHLTDNDIFTMKSFHVFLN